MDVMIENVGFLNFLRGMETAQARDRGLGLAWLFRNFLRGMETRAMFLPSLLGGGAS